MSGWAQLSTNDLSVLEGIFWLHGPSREDLSQRLARAERVDLVVMVTPNHLHYEVARAFVDAGFDVVCDKPMVHTVAQAE
jgi:predicted dehydrogenase